MKLVFEVENVFDTDEPRIIKARLPFKMNIAAREGTGNVHHVVLCFNVRLAKKMIEDIEREIKMWG